VAHFYLVVIKRFAFWD